MIISEPFDMSFLRAHETGMGEVLENVGYVSGLILQRITKSLENNAKDLSVLTTPDITFCTDCGCVDPRAFFLGELTCFSTDHMEVHDKI